MKPHLFTRKPLELLMEELAGHHRLKRVLGPIDLSALGVGAIIGTGIFVLTGVGARDTAGPALILSFVVAGIACIFAAFCYAEFASMVPVAGSAYTYAYATLGELFAWIIGWDLVLEYAVGAATVAHGWSHYFQDLLKGLSAQFLGVTGGAHLPTAIAMGPFDFDKAGHLVPTGGVVDLPAIVIAALVTMLLVRGIKESTHVNTAMVAVKLVVVVFVIAVGAFHINPANWHPFAPYGYTGLSLFGKTVAGQSAPDGRPLGMLAGAAVIFFAYIGFDSVSTHAEEARQPNRDVPIGLMTSLVLCTLLYIAVSAVITGMVPYNQIDKDAPVSTAFAQAGLGWAQILIAAGALAGITSVLLVMMLSQPRVLMAMARDGLLPPSFFGAVHEKFQTPWKSTILTGVFVATLSGLLPINVLADLVNIGTLLAFAMVCGAVWIMRHTHPEAERPFRVPLVPLIPILGIGTCLMLMFSLPPVSWVRLAIWLGIGLCIYFAYGQHNSVMAHYLEREVRQHGLTPHGALVTGTEPEEPGDTRN